MNENRSRNSKKFSNLFLLLAFCLVFSFGGLLAYIYFQVIKLPTTKQLAQTNPQSLELKAKIENLYNDQRLLVAKFAPASGKFVAQFLACKLNIPDNIPASKKLEYQNLQIQRQNLIEKMKDNSRGLISSAFTPFTGMDLDETAMMKESLVQIQVFMKEAEIKKTCVGAKLDDFQVDQNQLVIEISENADKAKNLIIDFKLATSLTK